MKRRWTMAAALISTVGAMAEKSWLQNGISMMVW